MDHNSEEQKRILRTARLSAMVMVALCVAAIGFLLYAFDQKSEKELINELAQMYLHESKRKTNELDSINRISAPFRNAIQNYQNQTNGGYDFYGDITIDSSFHRVYKKLELDEFLVKEDTEQIEFYYRLVCFPTFDDPFVLTIVKDTVKINQVKIDTTGNQYHVKERIDFKGYLDLKNESEVMSLIDKSGFWFSPKRGNASEARALDGYVLYMEGYGRMDSMGKGFNQVTYSTLSTNHPIDDLLFLSFELTGYRPWHFFPKP